MEAKDTVMNSAEIAKAKWINPNFHREEPILELAKPWEIAITQAQAESSFKAGMREVVVIEPILLDETIGIGRKLIKITDEIAFLKSKEVEK